MGFRGVDEMLGKMDDYGMKVQQAKVAVATYFAPIIETYAKTYARWEDQTGNARQGLHAWVEEESEEVVKLFLAHGVEYGLWLEVRWAGKYAIIWEALSASLNDIAEMLQGIFG